MPELSRTSNAFGGFRVNVKRFYVPFTLKENCPNCGERYTHCFDEAYLSYPMIGEPETVNCYCYKCDHEWERQIILTLDMRLHDAK